MIADVSLAAKGHQKSFGFSYSLSLLNSSFMKGNQLTRRLAAFSKGWSQPDLGSGRDLLSNRFTTYFLSSLQ
jgi:hypothetical protein